MTKPTPPPVARPPELHGTGSGHSAEALIRRKEQTWPEACSDAGDLVVRLFRLRDLIHGASRRMVKARFDLTPAAFEVVVTLRTIPPPHRLTPTDLRHSMLITPGGLTKVMRNLEDRGFVRRLPSGVDGRSSPIELTEAGIAMAEQALPAVLDDYAAQIGAGLNAEEAAQLSTLLARALSRLEG